MVPKRAHRFLQWKMSCCYCCSTQYLIGGWRSLAHPTTTSLLGPSWLAGGGLGAIVNIRGRGPAGLSTAVWGSRVRGCIGGILRPLLITEDKKDKKCKWIISRKTTTTTTPPQEYCNLSHIKCTWSLTADQSCSRFYPLLPLPLLHHRWISAWRSNLSPHELLFQQNNKKQNGSHQNHVCAKHPQCNIIQQPSLILLPPSSNLNHAGRISMKFDMHQQQQSSKAEKGRLGRTRSAQLN